MVDMCGHLTLVALTLGHTGGHTAGGILGRTSSNYVTRSTRTTVDNAGGNSSKPRSRYSAIQMSIGQAEPSTGGATVGIGHSSCIPRRLQRL